MSRMDLPARLSPGVWRRYLTRRRRLQDGRRDRNHQFVTTKDERRKNNGAKDRYAGRVRRGNKPIEFFGTHGAIKASRPIAATFDSRGLYGQKAPE